MVGLRPSGRAVWFVAGECPAFAFAAPRFGAKKSRRGWGGVSGSPSPATAAFRAKAGRFELGSRPEPGVGGGPGGTCPVAGAVVGVWAVFFFSGVKKR